MAYYAPGTIIPSKLHLMQKESRQLHSFRFLDLPGEIRNKIYDLVFENCLVDVRVGHQEQFHRGFLDRPSFGFQKTPHNEHDKKLRFDDRKAAEKHPCHIYLDPYSRVDSREAKQAPTPLAEQLRTIPQRRSKPGQRGRGFRKRDVSRMYHDVLSASGSNIAGTAAVHRVPFDFLFSCRQIYNEALCVMYARIVFRFTTNKALNQFLLATPLKALQAIHGLEIFHATYGEPELTVNRKFKLSADKKWSTTCKQIRERMTGLKNLRVHLQLHDWPCQLGLREEWAQPILSLRPDGFDRVDASLSHALFSDERLNYAARDLETAMMSKEGRLAKIAQDKKLREVMKKKAESKARKVLIIKMDNTPTTLKAQKA